MRVTKIIREHVEKVVGAKYDAEMNALKETRPEPVKIPDEYYEWAKVYVKKIAAECMEKLSELGVETIKDPKELKVNYINKTADKWLEDQLYNNLIPSTHYIKDRAMDEYDSKVFALTNEKRNTIDDILIRLELGEVKKDELDEILAKFK